MESIPPGNLVEEDVDIRALGDGIDQGLVFLPQGREVRADPGQLLEVQPGVELRVFQGRHDRLRRGLGSTPAERAHGRIQNIDSRLNGGLVAERRHSAGAVAVQVDGELDGFLEGSDQVVSRLGGNQAGHVLDADGIAAGLLQLDSHLDEVLNAVHRADRVTDCALDMGTPLLDGVNGGGHVADVIQGVENPEDSHPVPDCQAHELFHHVIGVMAVPHQVLAPEEHLERRVRDMLFESAEAFPRVFVQETDAGIEGRASPGFQGKKADPVHFAGHGQDVGGPEAGGHKRLVGIAQRGIGDLHSHKQYLFHGQKKPTEVGKS